MLGLVNVVKCCCPPPKSSGGGGGLLLGLVALGVVGYPLYKGLEATLIAIAPGVAAANHIAAWGFLIAIIIVALGVVGWLFYAQRRREREEPVVAAFTAQVEQAFTQQRRLEAGRRQLQAPQQRITVTSTKES